MQIRIGMYLWEDEVDDVGEVEEEGMVLMFVDGGSWLVAVDGECGCESDGVLWYLVGYLAALVFVPPPKEDCLQPGEIILRLLERLKSSCHPSHNLVAAVSEHCTKQNTK